MFELAYKVLILKPNNRNAEKRDCITWISRNLLHYNSAFFPKIGFK